MLSIGGGGVFSKVDYFRHWGDKLGKLIIFRYWGNVNWQLYGRIAYSSIIIAVLTKNAADRTDLRYIIRIISTHASWLGRLTIHRIGNFPLP